MASSEQPSGHGEDTVNISALAEQLGLESKWGSSLPAEYLQRLASSNPAGATKSESTGADAPSHPPAALNAGEISVAPDQAAEPRVVPLDDAVGRAYVDGGITLREIAAGGKPETETLEPKTTVYFGRHAKESVRRRRNRKIALTVGAIIASSALALGAHTPEIVSNTKNQVGTTIEGVYLDIISAW